MESNKNRGWISWFMIVLAWFLFWPLGLALLLWKLFGKDRVETVEPSLGEQRRETVDTRINKPKKAQKAVEKVTKSPAAKEKTIRRLKRFGVILGLIGGVLLMDATGTAIELPGSPSQWLEDVFTGLAFLIGGGGMFLKGRFLQKDLGRYANYLRILGDREAVSVEELARISGFSPKQVEKDLRAMVEAGSFGEGAYLNRELGYLFRSSAADRDWQEKQRTATAAAPKEAEEGYSGILREIRRANDEIADPVLSAKIDQLEDITGRIFRIVEADPEKAKRIDTFLNYYLPTTQKLLDSYARFEAAGVEGENLSQAKARIASTMDMIVKGFSHQLDALYQADAMDVDSDIRVMESMLKRDTGTVAEDFGLGGTSLGGTQAQRKPEDF